MAGLFLEVLRDNREKGRLLIHSFVVMRDHVHLLLPPQAGHTLSKCMQFIKGGFSFRAGKDLDIRREIWQPGFTEHFIQDLADYGHHMDYIHENPVRAGMVRAAREFSHSSIHAQPWLDPAPRYLQGRG